MDYFQALASGSSNMILAVMVLALATVVVYQWKYTKDKTIPRDLFDNETKKNEILIKMLGDLTSGVQVLGGNIGGLSKDVTFLREVMQGLKRK